jgi:hypothetical protein
MISFHVLELSPPNYLFCDSQKTLILNYIKKKRKKRDVFIHGPAGQASIRFKNRYPMALPTNRD